MDKIRSFFTALIGAPWLQSFFTLVSSFLSSRRDLSKSKNKENGSNQQSATTYGSGSPVTQVVNQNTLNFYRNKESVEVIRREYFVSSGTTSGGQEFLVPVVCAVALVVASVYLIAKHLAVIEYSLIIVACIVTFSILLTFWVWPQGVPGVTRLRVLTGMIGAVSFYELSQFSVVISSEPTLVEIGKSIEGLSAPDAIAKVSQLLFKMENSPFTGFLLYETRLGGLVFLLIVLINCVSRILGAALIEVSYRMESPAYVIIRLGEWMMGNSSISRFFIQGIVAIGVSLAIANISYLAEIHNHFSCVENLNIPMLCKR
ncbi:hypothetical protein [Dermatophilus congolensis]|uniref:hypothetical protein n=1 Tax=Dermatophilus congolensis TaxID=1863 RepID=UPI001AAF01CB|nr:hypothetical protein [Dermatophilus congolensis]MBO3142602.1 hypothetical protein [Dermatophilus congolensis]MBO3151591.1 hypothetical protein [Dermatophilus congolensis]MBO3161407.1 hypothetical protein [Dermatophilus congolensis]MBO3162876.1 hypothetical protein [Dermatophilus congolensis]MBO3176429.1 hypothetical protein [Dermatophilus congolensis]